MSPKSSQRGYALTEVLIAAAIAAMVVAASATSISISSAAKMRSDVLHAQVQELEAILAKAKAGMPLRQLRQEHPAFDMTLSALPLSNQPTPMEKRPVTLTVMHQERSTVRLETIILQNEMEMGAP
ncbi:MAG: prepilin-type N-terminal cleavage/methylation domain-containing protein [Pseudomonadota bacterium]